MELRARSDGERRAAAGGRIPLPLVAGFAVFLLAMAYLVAASLTRRTVPTYAPGVAARGDTLTVEATDAQRWRYVSLAGGRVLTTPDTAEWEIAVRRYNVIANGDIVDLGAGDLDSVRAVPAALEANASAMPRWYRYSFLTHLLESNGHVYAVRTPRGAYFKLQVLSYYCPGLTAGCMTIRYAPLEPPAAGSRSVGVGGGS